MCSGGEFDGGSFGLPPEILTMLWRVSETTPHGSPPPDRPSCGLVEREPSIRAGHVVEIELSQLDLRYEGFRMKNPGLEERLLGLVAQRHRNRSKEWRWGR